MSRWELHNNNLTTTAAGCRSASSSKGVQASFKTLLAANIAKNKNKRKDDDARAKERSQHHDGGTMGGRSNNGAMMLSSSPWLASPSLPLGRACCNLQPSQRGRRQRGQGCQQCGDWLLARRESVLGAGGGCQKGASKSPRKHSKSFFNLQLRHGAPSEWVQ